MESGSDIDNTRYYNTLGVRPTATEEQIRAAYRNLARQHQPELGGDPDTFNLIKEAFNVLKDSEKRRQYDMYGETLAPSSSSGADMGGFNCFGPGFENMFTQPSGGNYNNYSSSTPPPPPQSQSNVRKKSSCINQTVYVSLEDSYRGKMMPVQVERTVTSPNFNSSSSQRCPECNGTGRKTTTTQVSPGMHSQRTENCSACHQSGYQGGVVKEQYTLELCIPKGVKSYEKIVFQGQGNRLPEEDAGDIIITIEVKEHDVFKREGADLVIDKNITFLQALAGVNFTIKHINGRIIRVKSELGEVIKDNSRKTLVGYGMPFYQAPGEFGNLFVQFNVTWPDKLEPAQVMGLNSLFGSQFNPRDETREDEIKDLVAYEESQRNAYEEGRDPNPPQDNNFRGDGTVPQCSNQ